MYFLTLTSYFQPHPILYLLHDFLYYLNTFEHFGQNNLISYNEETTQ